MSDAVFKQQYHLLKEDHRPIVAALEAFNVRMGVLLQAPAFYFRCIDKRLFPAAIRGRNMFIRFIMGLLGQRLSTPPLIRNDVFSYLLSARDSDTGEGLTDDEIGAESTICSRQALFSLTHGRDRQAPIRRQPPSAPNSSISCTAQMHKTELPQKSAAPSPARKVSSRGKSSIHARTSARALMRASVSRRQ